MSIQNFYALVGGSYQDLLQRLPSEAMIRRFLMKFPKDPTFQTLCRAVEAENRGDAFRAAHTLKGICLNLGFQRLFESCNTLTEALRPGSAELPWGELRVLTGQVADDYREIISALQIIASEME